MARKKKRRVATLKGTKPVPSVKGETPKQRFNRLKKAGYTELFKPEGTARKTKHGLRERARSAAINMIAKRDDISVKEAKKQYKRALVEIVWAQPTRSAHRKFLEISPGQWREIEKGKQAKDENTFGPVRKSPFIQRIQSLNNYWSTVHLLSETWDISITDARKYYTRVMDKYGKKDGQEAIYTDLGVYEERYHGSAHETGSGRKPKRKRPAKKRKTKKELEEEKRKKKRKKRKKGKR